MSKLDTTQSQKVCDFIYKKSGISLNQSKNYLLESRLKPLAKKYDVNIAQLIDKAELDYTISQEIINAISTNETMFFRDNKPFEVLRQHIFPELNKNGKGAIRIWSAACSSGQEVYSLAFALKLAETNGLKVKAYEILGTDICTDSIAKSKAGEYSDFEINRGISSSLKPLFFNQIDGRYRVKDSMRKNITFFQANLMNKFPARIPAQDLILCRNVSIYFKQDDKDKLYKKIHKTLKPNGYLLCSSTESLNHYPELFTPVYLDGVTIYKKK